MTDTCQMHVVESLGEFAEECFLVEFGSFDVEQVMEVATGDILEDEEAVNTGGREVECHESDDVWVTQTVEDSGFVVELFSGLGGVAGVEEALEHHGGFSEDSLLYDGEPSLGEFLSTRHFGGVLELQFGRKSSARVVGEGTFGEQLVLQCFVLSGQNSQLALESHGHFSLWICCAAVR